MRGRKYAAVLLVLSMLLMLAPMQALAEEGAPAETISESAEGETDESSNESVDVAASDFGTEQTALYEESVMDASELSEEIVAEEIAEASLEEDESGTASAEVEEEADPADEENTESVTAEESSEETEQMTAALEGESDTEPFVTQLTFSGSSSDVSWSNASLETDADGARTISFHASIPEGATASELNLNVLDTPNLESLSFTPAQGETIQYVVNVTDETGIYQFKDASGAVALADADWKISASVSESLAKAAALSADGAAGSYQGADTFLTSAGEGNGFSSVLQSQWVNGQKTQKLSYYQQMQEAASDTDSAITAYPVVQFKLTRAEAAASESETETTEETEELSGSVPLSVKKVLSGQTLKAEQFTFELKDENGTVLQTKKNALDGKIPFDSLQFTGDDLGEHKYTISEVMPEGAKAGSDGKIIVDHIEYDTHTENVSIIISLNDEGKLKATIRQSTAELTFTNKYIETDAATSTTSRTSPATGDRSPIMPYISMLAGAGLFLMMAKRFIRVYVRR